MSCSLATFGSWSLQSKKQINQSRKHADESQRVLHFLGFGRVEPAFNAINQPTQTSIIHSLRWGKFKARTARLGLAMFVSGQASTSAFTDTSLWPSLVSCKQANLVSEHMTWTACVHTHSPHISASAWHELVADSLQALPLCNSDQCWLDCHSVTLFFTLLSITR